MNGRIYDPLIGRFLSPDPFIPNAGNFQSYNRYSYVLNNPLSYTDPSGYFEEGVVERKSSFSRFVSKFWKPIVAIVLSVVTAGAFLAAYYGVSLGAGIAGVFTGTIALGTVPLVSGSFVVGSMAITAKIGMGAMMAAGAVGGFVSGLVTGGLKGGVRGMVSGALFGGVTGHCREAWCYEPN
jgi:hypothetical protein